jgi:hypothetical protein
LTHELEVWLDDILADLEELTGCRSPRPEREVQLQSLELEVARFLQDLQQAPPLVRQRMARRVADLDYDMDVARSVVRPSTVSRDFYRVVDDIEAMIEAGGRFGHFDAYVWRGFFERLVALRSRASDVHDYEIDLSRPLEAVIAYVQGVRNQHRLAPFTPLSHVRRVTRSRRR